MFAVHIGPTGDEDPLGRLYAVPHGRASILFALVAGVGVSLLASSRTRSWLATRATLVWRAVVLLPLGLALQGLDHGVAVILQDYALLFVLALVVLGAGDRLLLALAGLLVVVGPLGFLWGEVRDPQTFDRSPTMLDESVGELLHGLVLSGPYPLITWAAPFLLGMWLGRRDLRAPRLRMILAGGGALVTVGAMGISLALETVLGEPADPVAWDHVISHVPHSQMPLWLVGSTGSAAMVLGGSLIAADLAEAWLRPLVAMGQLALTVYVGHLLVLHVAPDALTSDEVGGAVLLTSGFVAAAMLFAVLWRAVLPRGPLEAVIASPPWLRRGSTGSGGG